MMVKELMACIDRKTKEIDSKQAEDIIDKAIEATINDYVNEARGCPS